MLRRFALGLALLVATLQPWAQEWTPERTNRLVNDYSHMLDAGQVAALEQRLVAFNDSTSNQILVVITPSLYGDEEQNVAQRIGEKWGVGQDKFDNGVVILIKSKTEEENFGAVAIATGYGVEGALPDVFCKKIIDDRMISPLGDGDYYRAIVDALDMIEPVLAGEYSYAQYKKENRRAALIGLAVCLVIVVILVLLSAKYSKNHPNSGGGTGGGGDLAKGIFWGSVLGGSGGGRGGGSGFGGFGSGGFGGFGGGSFGGGGAHGRF